MGGVASHADHGDPRAAGGARPRRPGGLRVRFLGIHGPARGGARGAVGAHPPDRRQRDAGGPLRRDHRRRLRGRSRQRALGRQHLQRPLHGDRRRGPEGGPARVDADGGARVGDDRRGGLPRGARAGRVLPRGRIHPDPLLGRRRRAARLRGGHPGRRRVVGGHRLQQRRAGGRVAGPGKHDHRRLRERRDALGRRRGQHLPGRLLHGRRRLRDDHDLHLAARHHPQGRAPGADRAGAGATWRPSSRPPRSPSGGTPWSCATAPTRSPSP